MGGVTANIVNNMMMTGWVSEATAAGRQAKKLEEGLEKGKKEGEQIGLEKGKKEGEQIGLEKGKKEGEQIGLEKGKKEGEQIGFEIGKKEGYNSGFKQGLDADTQLKINDLEFKYPGIKRYMEIRSKACALEKAEYTSEFQKAIEAKKDANEPEEQKEKKAEGDRFPKLQLCYKKFEDNRPFRNIANKKINQIMMEIVDS